jgi:hypothetical protein
MAVRIPEGYHTGRRLLLRERRFIDFLTDVPRPGDHRGRWRRWLHRHADVQIHSVVMMFDSKEDWPLTPAFPACMKIATPCTSKH